MQTEAQFDGMVAYVGQTHRRPEPDESRRLPALSGCHARGPASPGPSDQIAVTSRCRTKPATHRSASGLDLRRGHLSRTAAPPWPWRSDRVPNAGHSERGGRWRRLQALLRPHAPLSRGAGPSGEREYAGVIASLPKPDDHHWPGGTGRRRSGVRRGTGVATTLASS